MICPNCGRVIGNNEICTCKLEAVKKKDAELKEERRKAEEELKQEEERKQKEIERKKNEVRDKSDAIKNTVTDLLNNIVSDFIDFINSPKYAAMQFVESKNIVNIVFFLIVKLILTIFVVFSLSRSSFSEVLSISGKDSFAVIINSFTIFALSFFVDVIFNLLNNKINNKKNDIIFILSSITSKCIVQLPLLLLAAIAIPLVSALGFSILITSIVIGGIIDTLAINIKNKQSEIIFVLSYIIKYLIIFSVLFSI